MGPYGRKIEEKKRYSFHYSQPNLFKLFWIFLLNILTKLLFQIFDIFVFYKFGKS